MRFYQILLLPILCGALFGCAVMPQAPVPTSNPQHVWTQQQPILAQINHWQIKGLVGVVLDQQGESANVIWQQTAEGQYTIEFYEALGLGATYLKGQPGKVVLTTHDGKQYTAHTAEQLMNQALGWSLPMEGLVYWIRGLPVPNVLYQSQLNQYGTLAMLSQQGWTIQYLSYQALGTAIVPNKLKLQNQNLQVTIVIHQWQE